MSRYQQQQVRFGPPLTPIVKNLMIANGAIYILLLLMRRTAPTLFYFIYSNLVLVPHEVVYSAKIWQLVTYAFLHSFESFFHIVFNMLALWMFGCEIESYWGKRPFLFFYFLCVLGGGLGVLAAFLIFQRDVPTLGASAATLGLTAAYGVIFAERTIYLLLPPIPLKGKWLAVIWLGMDLLFFLQGTDVSIAAHLGGALTGYLYVKSRFRFSASATMRIRGLTLAQHFRRWKTRRHLKVIVRDADDAPSRGEDTDSHYDDGPTYH